MKCLLLPAAWLYDAITRLRNWCFDHGILPQRQFPLPIVGVGNLAVGGTGKTPHTELLVAHLLSQQLRVGVLSRGYGRQTQGFRWVTPDSTASEVGDEPLQMRTRFASTRVDFAVCENRVRGIYLMTAAADYDIIVLDDAFQHRYVRPRCNILLTTFDRLYIDDHLLPYGRLRERSTGAQRAQIIIVTKCPADLTPQKRKTIEKRLGKTGTPVFFTTIQYAPLPTIEKALLVTGIAHPTPLRKHLQDLGISFEHLTFPDHHNFTPADRQKIIAQAETMPCLLTTQKDAVRLAELHLPAHINQKVVTINITPKFLFDAEENFFKSLHSLC